MTKRNLGLFVLVSCLSACVQEEGNRQKENKPEEALTALQSEGLTCEVQKAISVVHADKATEVQFWQMVSEKLSQKELTVLVEHRETGCAQSDESGKGTVAFANPVALEECKQTCKGGFEAAEGYCPEFGIPEVIELCESAMLVGGVFCNGFCYARFGW